MTWMWIPPLIWCYDKPQTWYSKYSVEKGLNFRASHLAKIDWVFTPSWCFPWNVTNKKQEAHGPQLAHLIETATADMQMACNIFPIPL